MQNETVRSSKLRKLKNLKILVENLRKKSGREETFITWPIFKKSRYPTKNFQFCVLLNQVNTYKGKVKQYRGILFSELGGIQEFKKGWWNPPPPVGIRVNTICLILQPCLSLDMFLKTYLFGIHIQD